MTDLLSRERTQSKVLPDGWAWTTLDELAATLKSGGTPSTKRPDFYDGDIPYAKVEDIVNAGKYLDSTKISIAQAGIDNSSAWVVPTGSLLYTMYASYGVPTISKIDAATNQAIIALIPLAALSSLDYLYYYLWNIKPTLGSRIRGTTQANLNAGIVKSIGVPLPPLNEQCRIVEKIEEVFTKLDAGVRSLKQAREQLKSYRRSVLKAAVEGELSRAWREAHRDELEPASELLERILQERREKFAGKKYKEPVAPDTSELPTLPDGWAWASMRQFLTDIEAGKNFKCREQPPNDDELGLVKISSLTWGKFNEAESKTVTDLSKENPAHLINESDFLFSRANTLELVGACVVVHSIDKKLMLSDKVLRFQFVKGGLKSWILIYLRGHEGRQQIESLATGNQLSMRNISQASIHRIAVPLPSPAEMKFIVEEVERRFSVVDKLEATVEENLKQAAGLRHSILKQAFSGKLVPQYLDDEPAGVLLARIRSEREATNQKSRRPRRVREDDGAQGRLI